MTTEGKRPEADRLPQPDMGAHEKKRGEEIKSRSADPGQSSYGGFSGEDPRRQAQDLHPEDAKRGPGEAPRKGNK